MDIFHYLNKALDEFNEKGEIHANKVIFGLNYLLVNLTVEKLLEHTELHKRMDGYLLGPYVDIDSECDKLHIETSDHGWWFHLGDEYIDMLESIEMDTDGTELYHMLNEDVFNKFVEEYDRLNSL